MSAEPLLLEVVTLAGVAALAPDDDGVDASRPDEISGVALKLEGDARMRFAGDRLAPGSPRVSEAWRNKQDVKGRRRKKSVMGCSTTACPDYRAKCQTARCRPTWSGHARTTHLFRLGPLL